MKSLFAYLGLLLLCQFSYVSAAPPVPYVGKLSLDGKNINGTVKFSFSIVDNAGSEVWVHAESNSLIENVVSNGRYVVLLGGQGMRPLPADIFVDNEELYVRVHADLGDGNGLRHLKPDQRITSNPYAHVADVARAVIPKSINLENLSTELQTLLDVSLVQHLSPKFLEQPQNITPVEGEDIEYSIEVAGSNLSYQWSKDGVNLDGQNNKVLKIQNYTPAEADGAYKLTVSNEFGTIESQNFIVGIEFSKEWEINFDENINDVIPVSDNGWVAAGTTESNELFLKKIDNQGNVQWTKLYKANGTNELAGIIQSKEGGFMVLASSDANASSDKTENSRGNLDYWLMKVDSNGNKIWDKTYGGNSEDTAFFISSAHKQGYLLGGRSYSAVSFEKTENGFADETPKSWEEALYDFWVIRIDENGTVIWDRTLGSSGDDWINSIALSEDGGYVLTGDSSGDADGNKSQNHIGGAWDFWLIKIDDLGNRVWDVTLGGTEDDEWPVINSVDGGFVIVGTSDSNISADVSSGKIGGRDLWLVKIDNNGEKIWDRKFGKIGTTNQWHYPRVVSSGNSLFITSYLDDRDGDTWLVKTNGDGRLIAEKRLPYKFEAPKLVLSTDKKEAVLFGGTALDINSTSLLVKLGVDQEFLDDNQTHGGGSSGGVHHGEDCPCCEIKDGSVTLSKLSEKVLEELTKPITPDMLSDEVISEINSKPSPNSITKEMLSDDTNDAFVDSDILWNDLSIGGSDNDILSKLCSNHYGGYLLVGNSLSDVSGDKTSPKVHQGGNSSGGVWLVNLSPSGEILWDKSLSGSATYCEKTDDNGFLLSVGHQLDDESKSPSLDNSKTTHNGARDAWLVKIDQNGVVLWEKAYGGSGDDYFGHGLKTADGNYLFVGRSSSPADGHKTAPNYGSFDIWLVKIDENGTTLWDKSYGGSGLDYIHEIIATADGNYLIMGVSNSPANGSKTAPYLGGRWDYWLVKIDENGSILWDKSYGGSSTDYLPEIIATADGNYLIVGTSASPADGNKTAAPQYGSFDIWLVKIDENGSILWDKSYGGSESEYLREIIATADGNYLIAGETFSPADGHKTAPNYGSWDIWLVKIDENGTTLWDKSYGGTNTDSCNVVTPHSKGGFIIGGYSSSGKSGNKTSTNRGGNDMWLFKIDEFGNKAHGIDGAVVKDGSLNISHLDDTIKKYLQPEITAQPQSPVSLTDGQEVSLSAQAEGKYLEFQWLKNNVTISGATNSTFQITSFSTSSHEGNYSLQVSNDFGTVESVTIELKVQ